MKKNIFKSVLFAVLVLASSSCSNDWLDLNPSTELPSSMAITNYNDATIALAGMYDGLQGNSSYPEYYGARMIYYGDVRGDDMQARTSGMRSSSCYEMRYNVADAPAIWLRPYFTIRCANNIIASIDAGKITDGKAEDVKDIYAQALAVRALVHFDLVRVYGKPYQVDGGTSYGVPVILEPIDVSSKPGRNTVAEVYNQVIKDLTDAIPALKAAKSTGYINQWAAKALLARVYLYKGDNDKAYQTAVDVINNSPYKLWTTAEYVSMWDQPGNSELIFEIISANSNDWVDRESIGYLYGEDGYADAVLTKAFVDLISKDPNDVRIGLTASAKKVPGTYGTNKVFLNKYPGRADQGHDIRINDIPVLRISEMYLIAAEAASKMSKPDDAAKYLNYIVLRANPQATPVASADATLDRILQERRLEFVGEGHRFFDAMRNNKTITRYNDDSDIGWHVPLDAASKKFDNTYFRIILPISQNELSANPTINNQQNPGY